MSYSYREDFPEPAINSRILYQPFTKEEWASSTFASNDELQWFRDARYGMFIHFGLSTYMKRDLSWGVCHTRKAPDCGTGPVPDEEWQRWSEEFRLENFDAKEWVRIAQEAQCKYIVLITKHHDGFHMWDTAESEFKITNTPFGRDIVKEVVDACHEVGMPIGLYYSQRDWYHPDYMPADPEKVVQEGTRWTLKPGYDSPIGDGHHKYVEYQERVVRELCTNYGKIDVFWWDALWWGGMFNADMWDGERVNRLIRELQPGIIINNRCSIPGDFDTPEGRLGAFQDWRPWESCICFTDSWSYSATPPKEMKHLVKMITNNACGDGNLLLSWGPNWDGEFDTVERDRLLEFGAWLKAHGETLFNTRGGPWKCNSWGGSTYRGNTIYLHVTQLSGDVLDLPALPGRTILSATLLDGTTVDLEHAPEGIRLTLTDDVKDELDTIVVLRADQSVAGIEAIETGRQTIFSDETTYGSRVGGDIAVTASSSILDSDDYSDLFVDGAEFRFATEKEEKPWLLLDLNEVRTVTGVRVEHYAKRQKPMTVKVFSSADGTEWVDCGEVSQPFGEVQINGYQSGAWVPGSPTRYIKLQVASEQPAVLELRHCAVFAK